MRSILALTLPLLVILLVNGKEVFEEVCVRPNRTIVVASRPRKCPCTLKAVLVSRQPIPFLSATIYSLRQHDYNRWLEDARDARHSGLPLPAIPGTRVGIASFTSRHTRTGNYGWESNIVDISSDGSDDYVTIIVASGVSQPSCFLSSVSFEWKPSTCPLRFDSNEVSTRVVGGSIVNRQNDNSGEFASYNALVRTARGRCSASVLSSSWILTAAHCRVKTGSVVRVGGQMLNDGSRHTVEKVYSHPNFKSEINRTGNLVRAVRIVNDVALLKLSRPILNVRPITLNVNNSGPPPGTVVRATGYGQKSTRIRSQRLRMVDIRLLATEECRRRFAKAGRREIANGLNGDINVCIGGDDHCQGGVCYGDSGGPVVGRNVDGELLQVGVVSYGDTVCANIDSADVYVKISQYIPWIQNVTNGAATVANWGTIGKMEGNDQPIQSSTLPTWSIVTIGVVGVILVSVIVLIIVRKRRPQPSDGSDFEVDTTPGGVRTNTRSHTRSTVEDDDLRPVSMIIFENDRNVRSSEETEIAMLPGEPPVPAYRPRGSVNTGDLD